MSREFLAACHFTKAGHELLRSNEDIRRTVDIFWDTEQPETSIGGRYIGIFGGGAWRRS